MPKSMDGVTQLCKSLAVWLEPSRLVSHEGGMNDPLYQKELLRLAAASGARQRLSGDCAHGRAANPLCGDELTFDLVRNGEGRATGLGFECHACILVQASAELLARQAESCSREDVSAMKDDVAMLLSGKTLPAESRALPFVVFSGVAEHRNRHHCVLLPFDALLKAFAD